MTIEASGDGYAEFDFAYRLAYASSLVTQPAKQTQIVPFAASIWNQVVWNNFVWNGTQLMTSEADMGGEAENVSLNFRGRSDFHEAVRFSGARIMYSPRRYLR